MILSHSSYLSSSSSLISSTATLKADHYSLSDQNSETPLSRHGGSCSCGRRSLFFGATATSLLHGRSKASNYDDVLEKVHPKRPDWYEEFYASVMDTSMKSYESEIAGYKRELFATLKGKTRKVVEIGIGTGPNIIYYAGDGDIQVLGVDPNRKMEKYAKAAAASAGLPSGNFVFMQAVGEALPIESGSVDAVVGTLVLCSVKDVNLTLKEVKRVLKPGGVYLFVEHVAAKEGTALRLIQSVVDPLQQALADGCHLTRDTGRLISEAGFSRLNLTTGFFANALFINPHVYGVATK